MERSEDLVEWLLSNPDGQPESDELLLSTLLTFGAIFGRDFVESNEQGNVDGADTVEEQLGMTLYLDFPFRNASC